MTVDLVVLSERVLSVRAEMEDFLEMEEAEAEADEEEEEEEEEERERVLSERDWVAGAGTGMILVSLTILVWVTREDAG